MTKNISILGSTGSIGVQTLEVAEKLGINVLALSANSNIELLEIQARKFKPQVVAVADSKLASELKNRLKDENIKVLGGNDGIIKAATLEQVDTVVAAIVGIAGLIPVWEAIKSGKNIALANKETLVTAGDLIMKEASKQNISILPVDSEHSAIFQCLMGNKHENISKIILTASGGPFRGKSFSELESVTQEQALKHPNWSMGKKITIDSATLMNKALEVIEAKWLFDLSIDQIDVVIHPQSIIHSMVEYTDGSTMAQLGCPDMKLPIQFSLTYPNRGNYCFERLDLLRTGKLTFEKVDNQIFKGIELALKALKFGGTMPTVLNSANEAAVNLFLDKKIRFLDIQRIIETVIGNHTVNNNPSINDIITLDKNIKSEIYQIYC